MLKIFLAVSLLAAAVTQSTRESAGCAPLEHRTKAVHYARLINTAEARVFRSSRQYVGLPELGIAAPPDNYTVQLSTDARSYSFSLKDRLDPCQGAVFSDQDGLIYTATPIR